MESVWKVGSFQLSIPPVPFAMLAFIIMHYYAWNVQHGKEGGGREQFFFQDISKASLKVTHIFISDQNPKDLGDQDSST